MHLGAFVGCLCAHARAACVCHSFSPNYEKLRTSELIFDANESVAVPVGETYARL